MIDSTMRHIKKFIELARLLLKRILICREVWGIKRALGPLCFDGRLRKDHQQLWGRLTGFVNTQWYEIYSTISGVSDPKYVPDDVYHFIIEPKLNNRELALAYADKNMYDKFYTWPVFPDVLVRNINGILLDSSYEVLVKGVEDHIAGEGKIVVKPSLDSMGGKNVDVFENDGGLFRSSTSGRTLSMNLLNSKYKKDYVIQRYLQQHKFFQQFNPSSLNTIRVMTYRSVSTQEVVFLASVLRCGRGGAVVDNLNSGGMACLIKEDGTLNAYAVDKFGRRSSLTPDGRNWSGIGRVHRFNDMVMLAKEIARKQQYFRLLGFDVTVDSQDRLRVVEINNAYCGVQFFQMGGHPVFGKYTEEIIRYCESQ